MPETKLTLGIDFWKELFAKLTPKVIAILIALAMILLAGVFILALVRGSDVSFWGVQISQPSAALKAELEAAKAELSTAIALHELGGILDSTSSKKAALGEIAALSRQAAEEKEWSGKFSYKLFKLELMIAKHGDVIATNVADPARTEAYRLIQSVLADVGFFEGPVTGDPQKTREAVIAFQTDYNTRVPENAAIQTEGYFGYKTLEAIRSRYRLMSQG
jgi:hypothetical protein